MVRLVPNVHVLIRNDGPQGVGFLMLPHRRWLDPEGERYLSLPCKKTVAKPGSGLLDGTTVERFIDLIMQEDLGLDPGDYALDQELGLTIVEMESPACGDYTHYDIYPVDVWVRPNRREGVRKYIDGVWMTPGDAIVHRGVSPTAKAVFGELLKREQALREEYGRSPEKERAPDAPRRLLESVPDRLPMDVLGRRWHALNRGCLRYLAWGDLQEILRAGARAFNLRVADPYLRYQEQGTGLTWSFFTEKDGQDIHLHGEPTIEVYGVLCGELEIWAKPYHDRGASAWSHRVMGPHDWVEVLPMTCHIVRWRQPGIGVVFKGGTGRLDGVGRIGAHGKTKCDGCPCIKPPEVTRIEDQFGKPDSR